MINNDSKENSVLHFDIFSFSSSQWTTDRDCNYLR